jgi:hypothetical protein
MDNFHKHRHADEGMRDFPVLRYLRDPNEQQLKANGNLDGLYDQGPIVHKHHEMHRSFGANGPVNHRG